MADVENEVWAVTKLCTPGAHQNIVAVLQHGKLRNSPYYFFNMELCDFNLEAYTSRLWSPNFQSMVDWKDRLEHIWVIMGHITSVHAPS
jgi:hypothetical protein